MTEKELKAHREFLQTLLSSLGRDDIGVGELSEVDGMLVFALTRGDHTYRAELPVGLIVDRDKAKSAMAALIPRLSKVIEREHIEAAQDTD
jgi:hypothetical protein